MWFDKCHSYPREIKIQQKKSVSLISSALLLVDYRVQPFAMAIVHDCITSKCIRKKMQPHDDVAH